MRRIKVRRYQPAPAIAVALGPVRVTAIGWILTRYIQIATIFRHHPYDTPARGRAIMNLRYLSMTCSAFG